MRWAAVILMLLAGCGPGDFVFYTSPAGEGEIALVLWVDADGEPTSGIAVWRADDALRLTPPEDPEARLVAFVYRDDLLAPDNRRVEECLTLDGNGPLLPPPNGLHIAGMGAAGFSPTDTSPLTHELRFSAACAVTDCPQVELQRFDFGEVEIEGIAVHDETTVTMAGKMPGVVASLMYRVEQGVLTELGPFSAPARVSVMDALPGGGIVAKVNPQGEDPSVVQWLDSNLEPVRTSTFTQITHLSSAPDGFGIVSTQVGAWAIEGDSVRFLSEVGPVKVSDVAVHAKNRFAIRTKNELFVAGANDEVVTDHVLDLLQDISRVGIDADFLGWVGQFELVRERIDGTTVSRPRPQDRGNRLFVMEGLGGGDYVVAGEGTLAARWRTDHWCPIAFGDLNTSFKKADSFGSVVWLIGENDSMGVDNVAIRLEFSE